jgi:hypothetical protein
VLIIFVTPKRTPPKAGIEWIALLLCNQEVHPEFEYQWEYWLSRVKFCVVLFSSMPEYHLTPSKESFLPHHVQFAILKTFSPVTSDLLKISISKYEPEGKRGICKVAKPIYIITYRINKLRYIFEIFKFCQEMYSKQSTLFKDRCLLDYENAYFVQSWILLPSSG